MNPLRGEVACKVAGTDYTFCFTVNSMCALEEATGLTVTEIAAKLQQSPNRVGFKTIRALVWAGLIEKQGGITIDAIGRLAPPDMIEAVGYAAQAFGLAFPQATGGEQRPQTAAGGNGKRSSSPSRKRD